MLPIARANIDYSSTHSNSDVHTAPAQTIYKAGAGSSVLINGMPAIVQDDYNQCGDRVEGCSAKVFINGKGVHRLGEAMKSHEGSYSPSVCVISGDATVLAG